jgi:hypothetical protein
MTDAELLQKIVNAWEHGSETGIINAIDAIRTRLAKPDAEAVAWVNQRTLQDLKNGVEAVHLVYEVEMVGSIPLYEKT